MQCAEETLPSVYKFCSRTAEGPSKSKEKFFHYRPLHEIRHDNFLTFKRFFQRMRKCGGKRIAFLVLASIQEVPRSYNGQKTCYSEGSRGFQ